MSAHAARRLTRFGPRSARSGAEPRASAVSYPEASLSLLRNSVLDSMRRLLSERDWSGITLSDVAKRVGVSRQTLYNEFGSRLGLAQAYALRLVDQLVEHMDRAATANVGDANAVVREAVAAFLRESAADPLIRSMVDGEAKPDLLRLITIDAGPIIGRAAERLSEILQSCWVGAPPAQAGTISRAVVRLALSYVAIPPDGEHDVSADLADLFAPYIDSCHSAVALDAGGSDAALA